MALYEHLDQFAGKAVTDWLPGEPLPDPSTTIPRLRLEYDAGEQGQQWTDLLAALLDEPRAQELTGLVVGSWTTAFEGEVSSAPVVEALVAARKQLPHLRAIFLGDIISEENEISWIQQSDISPLLGAYPQLEELCVRGGNGLGFGTIHHERLRALVMQTGGLDVEIVRAVAASRLPALEHLELWLGTEEYGGTVTVEDLAPILSGNLFPQLTYLGLRDSQIADQVAAAVAQSPLLERIKVLDLSLGTLGDAGAEALLASPAVGRLAKLDIHHHYCTPPLVARLTALPIEVDASDPQEPDDDDGDSWRYVAVGE